MIQRDVKSAFPRPVFLLVAAGATALAVVAGATATLALAGLMAGVGLRRALAGLVGARPAPSRAQSWRKLVD
ncbi:MAG: hypothetical protein U0229_07780 [Anaeromyxobacter sp.]